MAAAGRPAGRIAARRVRAVVKPSVAGRPRRTRARDGTPTPRHGPHVPGAGIHPNPTPGPAGTPHAYGHAWVALALLAVHPVRGPIAPPLPARLYLRTNDLAGIDPKPRPESRTELERAVEQRQGAPGWRKYPGEPAWVVADGADAKAPLPEPVHAPGVAAVSRPRADAALGSVPGPEPPGRRGPAPTSGRRRIAPAKRAGRRRGGKAGVSDLYGRPTAARYERFVATGRPAGGAIRVVRVGEPTGWVAFSGTDLAAGVADIPVVVADRCALEAACREREAIVGAGPQQVRLLATDIGAFPIGLGAFTLTAAWGWGREEEDRVDRSASPWGDPNRRPSRADKRRAWRCALVGAEIGAALRPGVPEAEIQGLAQRRLSLAA